MFNPKLFNSRIDPVNLKVTDSKGVVNYVENYWFINSSSMMVKLALAPNLIAGVYDGNLVVNLCKDDPALCKQSYLDQSWVLPYRFNVRSRSNLTQLSPMPKASDWTTEQGSVSHNAYVPEKIDPSRINLRFFYPLYNYNYLDMWVKDGIFYTTAPIARAPDDLSAKRSLNAIDEMNGKMRWSTILADSLSGIFMGDDVFYGLTDELYGNNNRYRLVARELSTGAVRNSSPIYYDYFESGIYDDKAIYKNNSATEMMEKISGNDFSIQWSSPNAKYSDSGLPALDSKHIYYVNSAAGGKTNLLILDRNSGALKTAIDIGDEISTYQGVHGTAIVCDANNVAVSNRSVKVVDLVRSKLSYELRFEHGVACSGSTLYGVSSSGVEARNLNDGSAAWTWSFPEDDVAFSEREYLGSNLVLFENLIFVRLAQQIYAIDLKTHKTVWRHRLGENAGRGSIAVSKNGVLYTQGSMEIQDQVNQARGVFAFNLK